MRDINSLNKVLLVGHLGSKPEVRYLQNQRAVTQFSVATKERLFNPSTKETRDKTEWHRIVVWGKQAEFCARFLNKGRQVYVEGKLQTREWQDRDGHKRTTTEVIAQNVVPLGKREEAAPVPDEEIYQPGGAVTDFPAEPDADLPSEGEGNDDVPF